MSAAIGVFGDLRHFFRATPAGATTTGTRTAGDDRTAHHGIRCPLCRWQPRRSDLWACRCGHAWNTFETRALCPGCGYQWVWTACLSCHQWSLHEDWYETD